MAPWGLLCRIKSDRLSDLVADAVHPGRDLLAIGVCAELLDDVSIDIINGPLTPETGLTGALIQVQEEIRQNTIHQEHAQMVGVHTASWATYWISLWFLFVRFYIYPSECWWFWFLLIDVNDAILLLTN